MISRVRSSSYDTSFKVLSCERSFSEQFLIVRALRQTGMASLENGVNTMFVFGSALYSVSYQYVCRAPYKTAYRYVN